MRGVVQLEGQPELFLEREYRALGAPPRPNAFGVFEADEVLACCEKRGARYGGGALPLAEIRLVQIPGRGWLWSYSYQLTNSGSGFAPSLKWRDTLADTRDQAVDAAREAMAKSIGSDGDLCRRGRRVLEWLAAGCPSGAVA